MGHQKFELATEAKLTLLSCDLWDTLLQRSCHPDELKISTANRFISERRDLIAPAYLDPWRQLTLRREIEAEIGQGAKARGFDDEYEIEHVLERLIDRIYISPAEHDQRSRDIDWLTEQEILHEIAVTSVDLEALSIVQQINADQKIILSDFYMSAEKVTRILEHKGLAEIFDEVIVSCDLGFNKRSGRVFDVIHDKFKVDYSAWTHIGDNHHSDVTMAKAKRIHAIHYVPASNTSHRSSLEKSFDKRRNGIEGLLNEWSLRCESIKCAGSSLENTLYNEGLQFSFPVAGFSKFIYARAGQLNLEKIYFFAREGVFFEKAFRAYQSGAPSLEKIDTETLSVSRLATFFPSLSSVSAEELMRVWRLYSTQSMNAFFKTLGLEVDDYADHLARYELTREEPIQYPWQDERIVALLADDVFQKQIETERQKASSGLVGYLRQQGFVNEKDALIVDIGWRGTIHDNLAYLFPNMQMDGCYFGLQKFLNPQPSNTSKHGFLMDLNDPSRPPISERFERFLRPIEMLTNVIGGSTTGYYLSKTDCAGDQSQYVAEKLIDASEDRTLSHFVEPFQRGVLAGVTEASRWIYERALTNNEIHLMSIATCNSFLSSPPNEIALAYQTLSHNENFGVGDFIDTDSKLNELDYIKAAVSSSKRKEVVDALVGGGWPQAALRISFGGHGLDIARQSRALKKSLRSILPKKNSK